MELSDSSEEDSRRSGPSVISSANRNSKKSQLRRRASTSQLADHRPTRQSITPPSSPIRSVRSFTGVIVRVAAEEENYNDEEVDWNGYEKEDLELDPHTRSEADSFWSEEEDTVPRTILVHNHKTEHRKKPVDPEVIVRSTTQVVADHSPSYCENGYRRPEYCHRQFHIEPVNGPSCLQSFPLRAHPLTTSAHSSEDQVVPPRTITMFVRHQTQAVKPVFQAGHVELAAGKGRSVNG